MKLIHPTTSEKRPYVSPAILELLITSTQMLAASGDPRVQTSSEKASVDYDALVKGSSRSNYDVWDDDWSE